MFCARTSKGPYHLPQLTSTTSSPPLPRRPGRPQFSHPITQLPLRQVRLQVRSLYLHALFHRVRLLQNIPLLRFVLLPAAAWNHLLLPFVRLQFSLRMGNLQQCQKSKDSVAKVHAKSRGSSVLNFYPQESSS